MQNNKKEKQNPPTLPVVKRGQRRGYFPPELGFKVILYVRFFCRISRPSHTPQPLQLAEKKLKNKSLKDEI